MCRPSSTSSTSLESRATQSRDDHGQSDQQHASHEAQPQEAAIQQRDQNEGHPRHWQQHPVWEETKRMVNITIPTMLVNFGCTIPPALTASFVGRKLGSVYLDGFTLGMLTGNLLTLSIIQGLFTASDTLSPQAFGARNYREVGLLAIRGFVIAVAIMLPINGLLVAFMKPLLILLGQPEESAALASQWYQVYVCGLPFYALYWSTWKFLASQEIMTPIYAVLAVSCGVVLPVALELFIEWFGFIGSAMALVAYLFSQSALLLAVLAIRNAQHYGTWTGLADMWRDALSWKPMCLYFRLGAGGILSSSEWWYWEVLCLMIGTLGVFPLDVQTIPTQVMAVGFMAPAGLGTALAVRLGANLGNNVRRARQLGFWGFLSSCGLFAVLSILLYVFRFSLFALFTEDPAIIEACDEIWWRVVVYFFNLCVFGISVGVSSALGLQWTLGIVTTVVLWVFGLPALYYLAIVRNGGLVMAWNCIFPPYVVMNGWMVITFYCADWETIGANICVREGLEEPLLSGYDEERPDNEADEEGSCAVEIAIDSV